METRRAEPNDALAIATVQVKSWQSAYAHLLPHDWLAAMSIPDRAEQWRSILAQPHAVVVAHAADGIVGFVSSGPCRDSDARPLQYEIYALYVLPAHWRSGVGAMLLARGMTAARDAGHTSVALWAIVNNLRAEHFYIKHGFIRQEGRRQTFQIGGTELQEDRYELTLASRQRTSVHPSGDQQMQDIRFVVFHVPGPRWQAGKTLFDQPGVMAHVAHYRTLMEAGKLAFGGPHLDAQGGGMMIPQAGVPEAEIVAFAAADPAVQSGVLNFEVRPWLVGMRG